MEHTYDDFLNDFDGGTGNGSNGTGAQGVIGQPLWDLDGNYVGVLIMGGTLASGQPALFLQKPGQVLRAFQPGEYALDNGTQLQITADGNFRLLAAETSSGTGGGGTNQSALSAQGFQQNLAFLREQERLLRERGEIDAARALADQLVLIEQQHQNALERDDVAATRALEDQLRILAEQQGFTTSEREAGQEFTAGENELSRENAIRLQQLQEVGRLRSQILSDKAEGRRLQASILGVDPFRSAALAQGLSPIRGTPADLLKDELRATINQPVPQPASLSLDDISSTIDELSQTAGAGLPSTQGFGLPGLGRGGVIDMRKDKDGGFSPTIRSAAHGGNYRRPGGRSGAKRTEPFRVLVGEPGPRGEANPELLEIDEDEIKITPVASAAHGLTVNRPSTEGAGRRIIWPALQGRGGGLPVPGRPGAPISPIIGPAPTRPSGIAPPPTIPGRTPTPFAPGDISLPGIPPSFPSPAPTAAPTGPGFAPSPTEITQALAGIYQRLGFDQIPTFREGPFGGMQIPAGGLSVFDRLGVSPSLLRTLGGTGGQAAYNFFVTPSGELQRLPPSGSNLQDEFIRGIGFNPEDFLTVDLGDLNAAGFTHEQIFNAPFFAGQDIVRDASPTPFPLRREPIAFRPRGPDGNFADEQGIFLPAPRTLASIYRQSDPAVQAAIISAWETAFFTQDQIFAELDFFTPQGSFSPSQVAGFG